MAEVKMTAFPKYEAYKDSGVEWLGEIPVGWRVIKTKFISSTEKGAAPKKIESESAPNLIPYLGMDYLRGKSTPVYVYRQGALVSTEDSILLLWDGSNSGEFIKGKFGAVSSTLAKISFKAINSSFAWYVTSIIESELRANTVGMGIPHVDGSLLKNSSVPIPKKKEQTLIAQFLDQKTVQIDQAIAIKEQQIVLLKERKQIIIQQAVTQGLNPNAPMKDSDVEWIGQIPEHWEVKRAKYLFVEVDERSKTGEEELLSVSHMTGVTLRSEKNVTMFMAEDYTGSKLCRKNDLVINIMWAWMGALGVSKQTGIVSPSYGVFRQKTNNLFHSDYLEWLLKSTKYIEHYNKVSTGLHSSRMRFYAHMFFAMKLGFPCFDEQTQIVVYLEEQIHKFDTAADLFEKQIQSLKEYKTTLINSAVTGKIKITPDMIDKSLAESI